jgi:hypothetical protein
MKLLRPLFLSLCCLLPVTGFSLDRNAFTFTQYDLRLQIEPQQQRLGVRGKITLRNDSLIAQKNAVLQISSSLDWRSIKLNGQAVSYVSQLYTSDLDHTGGLSEAIVSFPREIPPEQTVELEVGYEGVILPDTTRLTRIGVPESTAKHSDWDQISPEFTAVRGVGYVTWYPIATEAASLSEGSTVFATIGAWKFRERGSGLRAQVCLTAAAAENIPTILVNDVPMADSSGGSFGGPVADSRTSCGEHNFSNLGFTVPTFVSASFVRSDAPSVLSYALEHHGQSAAVFTQAAQAVLPFITEWFGQPKHPVRVVDIQDTEAAPFESGLMLLTPFENTDPKLAEMMLAHQLTHAAFPSSRPWIAEGLAHFAQALWREQQAGRHAALDYMGSHLPALAAAEKATAAQKDSARFESMISTSEEEYYRSKAMFIWWMLRDMVGESVLKKAIAAYRPENDNEPSYVQKLIETPSHRDLEWFFDDWVYRDRGLPDFRVVSAYTRQMLKGAYLATISVENQGAAGAEVPVMVRLEGGEVTSKLVVHAKSTAVLRVEVPSQPREIVVNDGSVPETNTGNNAFQIQETRQ